MKIGAVGCAGRMGLAVIKEIIATDGADVAGGTELAGPVVGQDLGSLVGSNVVGVAVTSDPEELFSIADVVIDFTVPAATLIHAQCAASIGTSYVVGTTGLGPEEQEAIDVAAKTVPVIQAPNFSVGVNVAFEVTQQMASILGLDYDIEVVEIHHRHKTDAPSGTALGLGEAAARGRGVELTDVQRLSREGFTGSRPDGQIGFATLRGGGVVGDHTIVFAGEHERVEVTHKAGSRAIFAKGAVRAALWQKDKSPGLYSMADVLGFR